MADILEDAEAAIETLANGDFVEGPSFAALLRGLVTEIEKSHGWLDRVKREFDTHLDDYSPGSYWRERIDELESPDA